jgi:hypothetical protein
MRQLMLHKKLEDENKELKAEIVRLRNEVGVLNDRLNILSKHPKLVKGLQGETLVAKILNGIQTGSTVSFDVDLQDQNIKIEVKNSCLNNVLGSGSKTKRWNWARPFGENGGKIYDQLVLLGDADPNYQHLYLDPSSPYICFDIPFQEIMPLTIKSNSYRSIQLTTNPKTARSAASILYEKYQITLSDLILKYNF